MEEVLTALLALPLQAVGNGNSLLWLVALVNQLTDVELA